MNQLNGPPSEASDASPMDTKKAAAASQEISQLLKDAFEKHKTVCRGYRKLEDELREAKESSRKDREEMRKLKNENAFLEDELQEAKSRIRELSKDVGRLHTEVQHWNRKACDAKRNSVNHGTLAPRGKPSCSRRSSKDDVSIKSGTQTPAQLANRTQKNGNISITRQNSVQEIVILDSDGEEAESHGPESNLNNSLPVSRRQWSNDSRHRLSSTSQRKRTRDDIEQDTSMPRNRPLQTNTCKVCEQYWRNEDLRAPGELPVRNPDIPACKIHGKNRRPPNTPENFWKSARLSSP